jgi:formate dehydrogenase subunit beta
VEHLSEGERIMTMRKWLAVPDGNIRGALSGFLRALAGAERLDALLLPCRPPAGAGVTPALIEDWDLLAQCDPLVPVMSASMATLVSRLTVTQSGRRLGVVLRPCELRALVELTKLRQINLTDVLVIGVDCLGTYEMADYAALIRGGADPGAIWAGAAAGEPAGAEGYALRPACRMCEHPTPNGAQQVSIGLIGLDGGRLLIESDRPLDLPGLEDAGATPAREEVVGRLMARRSAVRDRALAAWRAEIGAASGLAAQLAACIRCHNCMVACPICYCKECVFRTPTFDHEPEQYFRWAGRKGAQRMPADTLLFHLTRMNHMATSCVGCGLCESACPSHLPVATMFRAAAERTQALFDYAAGRSLDEEPPVATFREDELREEG